MPTPVVSAYVRALVRWEQNGDVICIVVGFPFSAPSHLFSNASFVTNFGYNINYVHILTFTSVSAKTFYINHNFVPYILSKHVCWVGKPHFQNISCSETGYGISDNIQIQEPTPASSLSLSASTVCPVSIMVQRGLWCDSISFIYLFYLKSQSC